MKGPEKFSSYGFAGYKGRVRGLGPRACSDSEAAAPAPSGPGDSWPSESDGPTAGAPSHSDSVLPV
jgi:hypothetical protein